MRKPDKTIECKVRHILNSFGIKPDRIVMTFHEKETYNLIDEFDGEPYVYENPPRYDIDLYGNFVFHEKLYRKLLIFSNSFYRKYYIELDFSKKD